MPRPAGPPHRTIFLSAALTVAAAIMAGSLAAWSSGHPPAVPEPPAIFDAMPVPADNPMTPEKVELGRMLFFDKRLSGDGSRSCYSCHLNEHGLTDGREKALGAFDKPLSRSSPTLWNIAWGREFYWDGRSGAMEKQVVGAWKGGNMGADPAKIVKDLDAIEEYRTRFQSVFGGPVTVETVAKAISAYERTIFCADTRYDRFQGGDKSALNAAEKRGHELFKGKAACTNCHVGGLLTDTLYHNVGIGMDSESPDIGRGKVSKEERDTGAFKTPTLRDISRTAPYFHNGSVKSLREAVALMASGGIDNKWLDREKLTDTKLASSEVDDLVAFLGSLECAGKLEKPELP